MKSVTIKCPCCEGTGKTALSDVLQATLAVIPSNRWVSTQQITEAVGDEYVAPTAINNRLTIHLFKGLGLIERERRGKSWFWRRVK